MENIEEVAADLAELSEMRRTAQHLIAGGRRGLESPSTGDVRHAGSARVLERVVELRARGMFRDSSPRRLAELAASNKLRQEILAPDDSAGRSLHLAAETLQVLAADPLAVFSRTSWLCLYRIFRGFGIGAGDSEPECDSADTLARSCEVVPVFVRTLDEISGFFIECNRVHRALKSSEADSLSGAPTSATEVERLVLSWFINLGALANGAFLHAFGRNVLRHAAGSSIVSVESTQAYLRQLSDLLPRRLEAGLRHAVAALADIRATPDIASIPDPRRTQPGDPVPAPVSRHQLAEQAVERLTRWMEKASSLCLDRRLLLERLVELGRLFGDFAEDVRRIIPSLAAALSTLLDRRLLVASSPGATIGDVDELAFAAVGYGHAAGWHDERLLRACRLIADRLDDWDVGGDSAPISARSFGCFMVLLEHVDSPISRASVTRTLDIYDGSKVQVNSSTDSYGWSLTPFSTPARIDLQATADVLSMLRRIEAMLDVRINDIVMSQFSSIKPAQIPKELALEVILSSRYGRRWMATEVNATEEPAASTPAVMVLERMRAHLLGVPLPADSVVCSAVFYGPPGVQSIPLFEALARSCNVPVLQFSATDVIAEDPSDIDAHLRARFRVLSMLTSAVILLKEFEPLLHRRDATTGPDSGPQFLDLVTPSMLNRMQDLRDMASTQRFVFCLVTDQLGNLEPATLRKGRIDEQVGIHHPHLLARDHALSRTLSAIADLSRRLARFIAEDPRALWEIEWRDLERVLAAVFDGLGFTVELTPGSKDKGKDLVLACRIGWKSFTYVVEVKHWRSGKPVGLQPVTDFIKVVAREERDGGLFVSSSGYAAEVTALTRVDREKVKLGDHTKIVALCRTYRMRESGIWLDPQVLPEILFSGTA
jgi:hypothetical protein